MTKEQYELIECAHSYRTEIQEDGTTKITIIIPPEFRWLWLSKLTDMTVSQDEIEESRVLKYKVKEL